MIEKLMFVLLFALALLMSTGCAASRNLDRRSPSEVFIDVVCGIFEEEDYERYERVNRETVEKRRQWQRENSE